MDSNIKKLLGQFFEGNGFKRTSKNFYVLDTPDCECFAYVLKSRFGGDYYVDIGANLKEVGTPRDHYALEWHLSVRLEPIAMDYRVLRTALDADTVMTDLERKEIIEAELRHVYKTYISRWMTREDMVRFALSDEAPQILRHPHFLEYLAPPKQT